MTARPDAAPPERHPALVNLVLVALAVGFDAGMLWLIGHVGGAGGAGL